MDRFKLLKELTTKYGITGFEGEMAEYLKDKLAVFCDEVSIGKNNCVTGIIRSNKENAKKVMLEAHLDRIGLMVSKIDDNGFVTFSALGGIDERILPASEVVILGKTEVFGIIGAKPPHLKTKSDAQTVAISDMLIDTGICGDELRKKISIGDPILLKSPFCQLIGNRVSSPALDNRAGIAAILTCLEKIKKTDLTCDILVAFTSGEESGFVGARTVFNDIIPDLAVIVDVTHGRTPDEKSEKTFELGSGVIICRGPNLHYDITKEIIRLAKEKNIPHDIEVASASSGTNAWAIQTQRGGIPCALLSIPLRYMHTTVETVDMSDVEETARLLEKIVCGGVELA